MPPALLARMSGRCRRIAVLPFGTSGVFISTLADPVVVLAGILASVTDVVVVSFTCTVATEVAGVSTVVCNAVSGTNASANVQAGDKGVAVGAEGSIGNAVGVDVNLILILLATEDVNVST